MNSYIDLNIILTSVSFLVCFIFGAIFIIKNIKQKPTLFLEEILPTVETLAIKNDNQFYQRLLAYMEKEAPYIEINLTLSELASRLKTRPRNLSSVINKEAGMNFNQFINRYRIERAKQLLSSDKYSTYSMLGIAQEAGFSSKTTFNTTFKQFTSMTPSQFKKQALNK